MMREGILSTLTPPPVVPDGRMGKWLKHDGQWTKRARARTKEGIICDVFHQNAYSFCLWGMMTRFYGEGRWKLSKAVRVAIEKHKMVADKQGSEIPRFNDAKKTTFEMVRKVIDEVGL